jgi:2-oxoglutarate ferredoxin oxidoreductase subunit alpha
MGIDATATIFSRACASAGLEVLGKREFYSNIKGRHSYYHVMVSDRHLLSHREHADIVIAIDAETAIRHAEEVVKGGALIYNAENEKTVIEEVPTIEHNIAHDLAHRCTSHGKEPTLGGLVAVEKARGIKLVGLSYEKILGEIAPKVGAAYAQQITRVSNTITAGASFALLGVSQEIALEGLKAVFGGRQKIFEMNEFGLRAGFEAVKAMAPDFEFKLEPRPKQGERLFLTGNQAVALGKLAGGCRFQTYYPITPASDESEFLETVQSLPLKGGGKAPMVVVQTEDEIAAITMATGAALTGARASTSTSGPGFSLMMEGLGWASINEVPIVITLYMRSGPSTGMPTRSEQGDLLFALHAGHGDSPRIILASGDLNELVMDAAWVHSLADRYQMPIIHLVDKALAVSTGTVPVPDFTHVKVDYGAFIREETANGPSTFPRFKVTESGVSPRPPFGLSGHIYFCTGDEHDEYGHITEDPATRDTMMAKRRRKMDLAQKEIPERLKTHYHGAEKPDLLLVSWGSPKGAILEAMDELKGGKHSIGFLQVRLLEPFPFGAVERAIASAKTWACLEANENGQLADIIAMRTGRLAPHRLCKTNGRPVVPAEVVDHANKILSGHGRPREVLVLGR